MGRLKDSKKVPLNQALQGHYIRSIVLSKTSELNNLEVTYGKLPLIGLYDVLKFKIKDGTLVITKARLIQSIILN